jgi:hypothetical protein
MTPKEKAEELFYKMSYNSSDEYHNCSHYVAKNCTLMAVDAILSVAKEIAIKESIDYWQEVKQEIEKL